MDLIKTQLILKEVISIDEWDEYKDHIQINYIADSYFNELKETEIRNERMNLVGTMDPFVGKYFSIDYIRRQVLKHTDTEIAEIDKQSESEMAEGKIVDPAEEAALAAEGGGELPPGEGAPAGQQPLFSDDELSSEDAKRGEI